jgi:glucan biosynthesis protein C
MRRYDIDWIRVIAIGLLLIYHVAIAFQPWGRMIGFITSPNPLTELWLPMAMLNVWRIPLLFFVSGMGVYFALEKRTWLQLIVERIQRIFIPFLFGMFVLIPISLYLLFAYYKLPMAYVWSAGHLWFLGNIMSYVVMFAAIFYYLIKNRTHGLGKFIRIAFGKPITLLFVAMVFALEVVLVKPYPFEMYAMTFHGFVIGLLAFLFGFCFVYCGDPFWKMIQRWRWVFLAMGAILFIIRMGYADFTLPPYSIAVESVGWVFFVLAFGSKYLNKPSPLLSYLSGAAYPVYILHMIFLYLSCYWVFSWKVSAAFQFVAVLILTMVGCFVCYEILKRIKFLRPLIGLKYKR